MSTFKSELEQLLTQNLGHEVQVLRFSPQQGGDTDSTQKIETTAGLFFVKSHASAGERFKAEARQLELLNQSSTSLLSPTPLGWSERLLVLPFIESGPQHPQFDELLGIGLAELHQSDAASFGFDSDTYCGPTRQPNPWTSNWAEFYGEQRLRVQLKALVDNYGYDRTDQKAFETLIRSLPDRLPAQPKPALIHGDLWAGNVMSGQVGHPVIIDPASYFADREAEFGMTTLFGAFGANMYAAYQMTYPLAPGWRERLPLYQLWHMANHANIFGGGYLGQTRNLVRELS